MIIVCMKNNYSYEKEEYSKPNCFSFRNIVILILCFTLCVSLKPAIENILIMNDQFHYSEYLLKLEKQKQEQGLESIAQINQDFLGWLEIEDVGISFPVVNTSSKSQEDYYLNHDYKNEKNSLGCPFQVHNMSLDGNNTMFVGHSSFTTTVLGNTNNQSLFGKLNSYHSTSNNYNYIIKFETLGKTYTYKIFGVFKFNVTDYSDAKYQEIFNDIYTNTIRTSGDFKNFVNCAKKYSTLNSSEELNFGDKILTLFTCYYDLDYRTMIIAKQI